MSNSNYQESGIDLDFTYISSDDLSYFPLDTLNITGRKTVICGQNALTVGAYPVGNLGKAYSYSQSIAVPKIDIDSSDVVGVLPNAVIFQNRNPPYQSQIRAYFPEYWYTPQTDLCIRGITNRSYLVQLGYDKWKSIISNYTGATSTLAIKVDGTLWSWGYNAYGQLGLGTTTNRYSPTQIGNANWNQIACGTLSTLGIQSNGTLWSWGYNNSGQLGLSDNVNRSSPVQVGSSLWKQISSVGSYGVAIQSDGTLWSWGYNAVGQLGLSDLTNRSTPVQVGASNLWKQVACGYSHTLAIQSNGTLWSWGSNLFGQLGLSNQSNRYSPIQVGTALWKQISGGYYHTLAIQSNGTLWSWGNNSYGQLGLSDQTHRYSPVQVGTSLWKQISGGNSISAGIQSDGTLWVWGYNLFGQYGISNTTDRWIPTQNPLVNNTSIVSFGQYNINIINSGFIYQSGEGSYAGYYYSIPGTVDATGTNKVDYGL